MAIDPRGMTPENKAVYNAEQSAAASTAAQDEYNKYSAQQTLEQMHNDIVRTQVLSGKTFSSETGQAGASSKYSSSSVGSGDWWTSQISAREVAAAANTQSAPVSPSTPGYATTIAPPITAGSVKQSEDAYIASLPKPFLSSQPQQAQQQQVTITPVVSGVVSRFYVPEGSYAQQELQNVKIGLAQDALGRSTGETAWYTKLPSGRMTIDPDTGQLTSYMLIGGGGRNFAQSGTAGFAAATPLVYAQGGVGTGILKSADIVAPGVSKSGVSAADIQYAIANKNVETVFSRLGAEAYGGIVTRQDARVLGGITYEDVSNRAPWNLASYVNPTDVNLAREELPGVRIPWSVFETTPGIFSMTVGGGVGRAITAKEFAIDVPAPFKRLDTKDSFIVSPYAERTGQFSTTPTGLPVGISAIPDTIRVLGKGEGIAAVPGSYSFKETVVSPSQPTLENLAKNTASEIVNTLSFGLVTLPTRAGFETRSLEERYSINLPTPFVSSRPAAYTPSQLTYDVSKTSILREQSVYDVINTGISRAIPQIPIETQFEIQSQKGASGYAFNVAAGGYQAVAERPLDVAKYASLGVILAAGGALVSESAIAASTGTRAAGAVATAVSIAPVIMGGAYAYSVGERSTLGFTQGGTTAASRLGGILSTEALPMFAGGYGYSKIGAAPSVFETSSVVGKGSFGNDMGVLSFGGTRRARPSAPIEAEAPIRGVKEYVSIEDVLLPQGEQIPSVKQIRQLPIGEPTTYTPTEVSFAPEFSIKTGTEALDIGRVLGGRAPGQYPSGVVEGVKTPSLEQMPKYLTVAGESLVRVDPLYGKPYYTPDIPPVPMDILPGVGKIGGLIPMESPRSSLLPGGERPTTFGLPKIESFPSPKGLETSFGGAPMSTRMQASMINPEISTSTRAGAVAELDVLIQERIGLSRLKPVTGAAEQLRVVPSVTEFPTQYAVDKLSFETAMARATEQPRATSRSRGLPSGMQLDYLRDVLKQRSAISGIESIEGITTKKMPLELNPQILPQDIRSTSYTRTATLPQFDADTALANIALQQPRETQTQATRQILLPMQGTVDQARERPSYILRPTLVGTPSTPTTVTPIDRLTPPITPWRPETPGTPPPPVPTVTIPKIPLLPLPFSGSGGAWGGGPKWRRSFLETFRMGLDISSQYRMPKSITSYKMRK